MIYVSLLNNSLYVSSILFPTHKHFLTCLGIPKALRFFTLTTRERRYTLDISTVTRPYNKTCSALDQLENV